MAHGTRILARTAVTAAILVSLIVRQPSNAGEARPWTYTPPGSKRSMKFEAEFLELRGDLVVLRNNVGKKAELPIATLGPEDRRYVGKVSRTDQGEFIDWTDAFGNTLRVRYAGIDGQMLILASERSATFQVPIGSLDATQKAFVQRSQQAAAANKAAADGAARTWKPVDKGIEVATLNPEDVPDREKEVELLMFLHQTQLLLSVAGQFNALWNTTIPQRQHQLEADRRTTCVIRDQAYQLRFDSCRKLVWLFQKDGLWTMCWDLRTGRLLQDGETVGEKLTALMDLPNRDGTSPDLVDVQFSLNGKLLAVLAEPANESTRRACLFDVGSNRLLESLGDIDHDLDRLEYSADGRIVVGFDQDLDYFHTWDLATKQHLSIRPRCGCFGNLVDNGQLLAGFRYGRDVVEFTFIDTATGNQVGKHSVRGTASSHDPVAAISPVGRCVAAAFGPTIYLDDWAKGTNTAVLSVHQARVTFMTFSDDASLLATGDEMGQINLWRIASVASRTIALPPSPTTEPDTTPGRPPSKDAFDEASTPRLQEPEEGFVPLFDGKTLNGWEGRMSLVSQGCGGGQRRVDVLHGQHVPERLGRGTRCEQGR